VTDSAIRRKKLSSLAFGRSTQHQHQHQHQHYSASAISGASSTRVVVFLRRYLLLAQFATVRT
jgi:hypothetical protein